MDELETHVQVGITQKISRDQSCIIMEAWVVVLKEVNKHEKKNLGLHMRQCQ